MNARVVDLFHNTYANFADEALAAVREQTYGYDIGQNSWVTVDEYDGYIASLGLDASARVLDVASGSGGPALYVVERTGCKITGIDVNASGVRTARTTALRAGHAAHATFEFADAQSPLKFADGTFDALMCIDSMNHFPDRLQTLQEWHRVLKPGGRAVFTDPVVLTGPVTNEELALRSSIGLFVFLPAGLNEELIMKAGFRIVSQTDATENAATVSRRWREAREQFRDALSGIEGHERFAGVQNFLAAVHKLTRERRLSRFAWVVEKPVN